MEDSKNILEIRDLCISYIVYAGKLQVLDHLNIDLPRGQSIGLVGESGCGKTTLLKSLLGILPPSGHIDHGYSNYNGNNIYAMTEEELQRFRRTGAAMIFQDPSAALNPVITIGHQLETALRYAYSGKYNKKELYDKACEGLLAVSLADPQRIMKSYPFQLSGGMRQRVCIAMALAAGKNILLADEPGTSLDVTIQDQILRLVSRLVAENGLSVVFVSHSLGVIREVASYVNIMYAGTIVESGPTRSVFNNPCHPYTIALLACLPKLTGDGIADGIPGRIPDYLHPPEGCRYCTRCPLVQDICCHTAPPTIEAESGHFVGCHMRSGR